MQTLWQTGPDGLACRWSEPAEPTPSHLIAIEENPGADFESYLDPLPDFAAHSLLGSGEWLLPWNVRWSKPATG